MRLNQFVALATGISRRAADKTIEEQRVVVNGVKASHGLPVVQGDIIILDGHVLQLPSQSTTIKLNKPVGYVCSRAGQHNPTIYDLLPASFQSLKPVGRLDKDSSGLILLTNNGLLAHQLTHPSFQKVKTYNLTINRILLARDKLTIEQGVSLGDGLSRLKLVGQGRHWTVMMSEGRKRQIRRTFESSGYRVISLHRISFGPYKLGSLKPGAFRLV